MKLIIYKHYYSYCKGTGLIAVYGGNFDFEYHEDTHELRVTTQVATTTYHCHTVNWNDNSVIAFTGDKEEVEK